MLTLLRLPIVLILAPIILAWLLRTDPNTDGSSPATATGDTLVLRLEAANDARPPLPLVDQRPRPRASIRASEPNQPWSVSVPINKANTETPLIGGRICGWSLLPEMDHENGPPAPPSEPTHKQRKHRVVDGDTLPDLAADYLGDRERYLEIYEANQSQLVSPDLLPIGVSLQIPDAP